RHGNRGEYTGGSKSAANPLRCIRAAQWPYSASDQALCEIFHEQSAALPGVNAASIRPGLSGGLGSHRGRGGACLVLPGPAGPQERPETLGQEGRTDQHHRPGHDPADDLASVDEGDGQARPRGQDAPEVDDEDGSAVGVPDLAELVVDVLLV